MTTLIAKPWPLEAGLTQRMPTDPVATAAVALVADPQGLSVASLGPVLAAGGFSWRGATTAQATLRSLYELRPAVVLACISPSAQDDVRLIERIRELCDTPILAIGGAHDEATRLAVFQAGADDHLDGTVSPRELVCRLRARLRRQPAIANSSADVYSDGCLTLDARRVRVTLRGRDVPLSPTEFRLLKTLTKNAGSVLSPEQLLDACWSTEGGGVDSVRVYIGYLRRKLHGRCPHGEIIETVRGFGYRYAAH